MKRWYVIYTKASKEKEAELHLKRQGYETCLPLIRRAVRRKNCWHEHVDPLFPRYLFIRLQLEADNISPVRSTRGVVDFVRLGNYPNALPDGFVETLIENFQEGVHESRPLTFNQGDVVRILSGPFAGNECDIEFDTGSGRVVLLLELLGQKHRVSMDTNQLEPVSHL